VIIPWQVDVPQDRYPLTNWLLIAAILAAFVLQMAAMLEYVAEQPPQNQQAEAEQIPVPIAKYVLQGWNITGLFGHMWLHGGIMHLLGNLLFLWVFGNAVCAKIGNFKFLPIYIVLGLIAGVTHLMFSGGPMIGASGAINGVVGMFLVFFPQNDITCYWVWWLFLIPRVVEFTVSSYWMILLWFAFDLLGALFCSADIGGVAYFAHIGGFLAGFVLAIILLKTRLVVMEPRYERSLLDLLAGRKKFSEPTPEHLYGNFQRDLEYAKTLETQSNLRTAPPATVPLNMPDEERKIQIGSSPAPSKGHGEHGQTVEGASQDFIRFVCPCGQKVKIPAKYAGKTGRCPRCKKQIKIPYPS
jgi:membrane associated rhomboid family serine protease